MERINVAELLKDCPQGMELDCTMYNNLHFDSLNADYYGTINCYTLIDGIKTSINLTKYGTFNNHPGAKCVIFPKGKTTWEGFHRPFKDGDVVSVTMYPEGTWIGVFKQYEKTSFEAHCSLNTIGEFHAIGCKNHSLQGVHLATEEEKAKLFQAIKDNGYKWNEETKTLEKLIEPKFKVGDKVKIKETGKDVTIEGMSWRNGCEVIYDTCYNNDCVAFYSAEELQPCEEETMESKPNLLQQLKEYFDNTPREVIEKEWEELSYLNEIGPTVEEYLESVNKYRQSNQYPKTYEECCKVLNICPNGDIVYAGNWVYGGEYLEKHLERIRNFQKLLICRDAYWKIAGEQMGLGKPWEPDYTNDDVKFCICCCSNLVVDGITYDTSEVFVFPTAEMRDAFKENFWVLIELCKELL